MIRRTETKKDAMTTVFASQKGSRSQHLGVECMSLALTVVTQNVFFWHLAGPAYASNIPNCIVGNVLTYENVT